MNIGYDIQVLILRFHEDGPWQGVCRLVCTLWAKVLSPPRHPFAPFEDAIMERSVSLLSWLTQQKVPWSIRVLHRLAQRGALEHIDWLFFMRPLSRRPLQRRLHERIQLTQSVIIGGLQALRVARSLPVSSMVRSLLCWNASMLAYVNRSITDAGR